MTRCVALFGLLPAFILGCAASKPEPPKPKIAISISEFEPRAGVQQGEAETVSDALGSLLAQTGRFTLIDRKQVQAVLQEQGFQAAQAGGHESRAHALLGVRKFLTGSLSKLGDNYILSIKMTDVETSQISLSISRTFDDDLEDIMDEFLPNIAKEILAAIDGPRR